MNKDLIVAAKAALEALERADCSTGYCCCGSSVESHGMGDGHSPVDEGSYYQLNVITALRAALDAVQEQPDKMPASPDERHLRRLLAYRVDMPQAYYDDGEAQGQEHGISIDFMREPVADIDAKLRALNVARAECSKTPEGDSTC